MSLQIERDPRAVLVKDKYFTLRPKPLERWLWNQGLPQAAERVFWLHWEEGMRRGDWCSELALKTVARECCVDLSTVTRAYQVLKKLDLIRREDPGRNLRNPFQQAVAITEVRILKDLLICLSRAPNRQHKGAALLAGNGLVAVVRPHEKGAEASAETPANPAKILCAVEKLTRDQSRAVQMKLSASEQKQFFLASRDRRTTMDFDAKSLLTAEERGRVLAVLAQISGEKPSPVKAGSGAVAAPRAVNFAKPRKLSVLEAARLRRGIWALVPAAAADEIFGQVLWSMEEGALRRFDSRLAGNIALKKIREGAWTKPNRMPPNWFRSAAPETCSAA